MIEQVKKFMQKYNIAFQDMGSFIYFDSPQGKRCYVSEIDEKLNLAIQAGGLNEIIEMLHFQFKINKQLELFKEVQND